MKGVQISRTTASPQIQVDNIQYLGKTAQITPLRIFRSY